MVGAVVAVCTILPPVKLNPVPWRLSVPSDATEVAPSVKAANAGCVKPKMVTATIKTETIVYPRLCRVFIFFDKNLNITFYVVDDRDLLLHTNIMPRFRSPGWRCDEVEGQRSSAGADIHLPYIYLSCCGRRGNATVRG